MRPTVVLTLIAGTALAEAPDDVAAAAFRSARYGACDATLLARHWGIDADAAAARAGRLLLAGTSLAPVFAEAPRQSCTRQESGLGDFEVDLLARLWAVDMEQAKVRVAALASAGHTDALSIAAGEQGTAYAVRQGYFEDGAEDPFPAEPDRVAFEASRYTFCDARRLARVWGVDEATARDRVGAALRAADVAAIDVALAADREVDVTCPAHELAEPLDAAALARVWGVSVEEAKARVKTALSSGEVDVVRAVSTRY